MKQWFIRRLFDLQLETKLGLRSTTGGLEQLFCLTGTSEHASLKACSSLRCELATNSCLFSEHFEAPITGLIRDETGALISFPAQCSY